MRYSLLTFTLVCALIGSAILLYMNHREVMRLRAEIVRLQNEVGELTITDPNKLQAISCKNISDLAWTWKVHCPENRQFVICTAMQDISETGIPHCYEWRQRDLLKGDVLLDVAIVHGKSGSYELRIKIDRPFTTPGPPNGEYWNLKFPDNFDGSWFEQKVFGYNETAKTMDVDVGQPMVLLRMRSLEKKSVIHPGVMIWIDEFKSPYKRNEAGIIESK